jgi:hypothetical protein
MGQTPEGKVKAMVKKGLASLKPDPYIFMPVQSGFGSTTLDFLGCVAGKFIAIETKADGTKKLTPRQVATMDQIHLAGGKVFVVYDQTTCDEMLAQLHLMMEFDPDATVPDFRARPGFLDGYERIPDPEDEGPAK